MFVEVGRPCLPRQAALDPGDSRGSPFGGSATYLHLTELRVGDQHAVCEDAGADPGPKRQEDDRARSALADTEAHLGDPRRVGVVDDVDRALEDPAQPLDNGEVDPSLVDVAGEAECTADRDARQADPDGDSSSRPCDFTSLLTSRPIEAMTASGVDGIGVGTLSRSEVRRPHRRRRPPP